MHIIEHCRALSVSEILNRVNTGAQWGPPGVSRKPDGTLGIVSAVAEWKLSPPPSKPAGAVYTVNLTTRSTTGVPPNPEPWIQDLVIVAVPCSGRLYSGPPRRNHLVAAADRYLRHFFLCPRCFSRRLQLYLPGRSSRLWACRAPRCWNLGYKSQLDPWKPLFWSLSRLSRHHGGNGKC